MAGASLKDLTGAFPSLNAGHIPTPIEPLPRLGRALGIDLYVKRDDCTGIAFGGNKVRQLNYYLGAAKAEGADTVLITGAVQSNFTRVTAAMAASLGMACHIQLEERVPDPSTPYRENGNVLLDRLFGATLHSYPEGEDEAGADAALADLADRLRGEGRSPYIVPLSGDRPPLGALGYLDAAAEVAGQGIRDFDVLVVGSGSALTHVGLLFGLRRLGIDTVVWGVCVRRDAAAQRDRVAARLDALAALVGAPNPTTAEDIQLYDGALAPGYGRLNAATRDAITRAATMEGLLLDPVYTGKVMAGVVALAEQWAGKRVLFWHTGGQPALFGYAERF
jgi:D-cysteine desulfhydrase family pyridoxal phosphate-dependent enzyme